MTPRSYASSLLLAPMTPRSFGSLILYDSSIHRLAHSQFNVAGSKKAGYCVSCNAVEIAEYLNSLRAAEEEHDDDDDAETRQDISWSDMKARGWKYKSVDQFSGKKYVRPESAKKQQGSMREGIDYFESVRAINTYLCNGAIATNRTPAKVHTCAVSSIAVEVGIYRRRQ